MNGISDNNDDQKRRSTDKYAWMQPLVTAVLAGVIMSAIVFFWHFDDTYAKAQEVNQAKQELETKVEKYHKQCEDSKATIDEKLEQVLDCLSKINTSIAVGANEQKHVKERLEKIEKQLKKE